jgi:hypothetical protein
MPRHDVPSPLEASAGLVAGRLMRDFDRDAALVAWGRADVAADCGRVELCRKWIEVMEVILLRQK